MRTATKILLALVTLTSACDHDEATSSTGSSSTVEGSSSTGGDSSSSEGSSSSTGNEPEPVRLCNDLRDCGEGETCSQTPGPGLGGYCAPECNFEGKCGTGSMCKDHACITPCTKANDCEAREMECAYFSDHDPVGEKYCALPADPAPPADPEF